MLRHVRAVGRGGFSLIELAVSTAIIGIGVLALMSAIGNGSRANGEAREMSRGVFLAQEIREWTLRLPFKDPDAADANNAPGPDGTDPQTFVDDLDDLTNVTFTQPRDGRGVAITELANWSQSITLTWRDPDNLAGPAATAGSTNVVNVQVVVKNRGVPVLTTSWLVARRN